MVGNVVRSLVCGCGYTSSTRQRGVPIMGEFMSTIQYNTAAYFFSALQKKVLIPSMYFANYSKSQNMSVGKVCIKRF